MVGIGKRPWFYVYTVLVIARTHLFIVRSTLNFTTSRLKASTIVIANTSDTCPEVIKRYANTTDRYKMKLHWETWQMDCFFCSFYTSYILSVIPSGYVADKYGSKHILAVGFVINSILTGFIPWVVKSLPWWAMVIVRAFMGIGQAMYIAAEFSLMAHWVPEQLITFLVSTLHNGIAFGIIINTYTSHYFFDQNIHWAPLFYSYSVVGLVIYMVIILTIFSTPAENPFYTEEDLRILDKELDSTYPTTVPWCMILKDYAVWSLVFGTIGHQWILMLISNSIFLYFKIVIGLDISRNVWSISLPYWAMIFSCVVTSYIADVILKRGFVPVNFLRTYITVLGNTLPCLMMVIVSNSGCNQVWVVILYSLGLLFKGSVFAGLDVGVFDITRHYCGFINAIKNSLGILPGLLTPILVSHICPDHSIVQWRKMFWISFSVSFTTTIMYYIWARSERAEWDNLEKEKEDESI